MTDDAPSEPQGLVERLRHPVTRHAAGAQLRRSEEGIRALQAALLDPDPVIRRFAARALDDAPLTRATFDTLVDLVRREPDPVVRSAAVHVLACEGCKPGACEPGMDVVGVLIDLLLHDPSAEVRRQTTEGLRVAVPEDRVLAALREARSDRSQKVRYKVDYTLEHQEARARSLAAERAG